MPNPFKCILGAALLICAANISSAQLWYLTRGLDSDEVSWAVDVDSTGSIYWAIGQKDTFPYWYYNTVMFKIAPDAQQIWQSVSWDNGTGFNDIAFKATVGGNHVYLSGRADSTALPTSGDALVLSYATDDGHLEWDYVYNPAPDIGYEEIDGLVVQPDGIYLSGWTLGSTTDEDFLIQKITLDGHPDWTNSWDYENLGRFDGANGHMELDADYLYIAGSAGRASIASLDGDAVLACFNRSDGSYKWHVTWGGWLWDDALGMAMSYDSMLYVVGFTGSYGNGSQVFLNKYTRSGQELWSRMWGGPGTEDCRAVVTDGDSIIYLAGTTGSYGNGAKDIFVLKYDAAGTLLDSLFWGGAYDEGAQDAAMSGDFLYITGGTRSYGNGQANGSHTEDGLLLKVNGRTMEAPDESMNGTNFPDNQLNDQVVIYPNPCREFFRIHLDEFLPARHELIIYDETGTEISVFKLTGKETMIPCKNFRPGIYLCRLIKDGIYTAAGKLIVK